MSAFEYLSVFISIILGLAVVHLLGGVSLMLDRRVRARLSWIHLAWVLNLFTTIMWVWWSNWKLHDVTSFSPVQFVAMVLFSVVLYLLAGLLFPVRGSEVEDFHEQFELNRVRFFLVAQALVVAAALKGYVDRSVLEQAPLLERGLALVSLAILFGVGARTGSTRFHGSLAVVMFLLILRWITTE